MVIRSRGRRETVNEESPSFLETGCRRNPGEGDFKESATEINRRNAVPWGQAFEGIVNSEEGISSEKTPQGGV